jgi:hypothetical protein
MAHEHSLGDMVKKEIATQGAVSRGKIALRAISKVLRKSGVSQAAITACVSGPKKGKKKGVAKKHDGTFEVHDIDSHDEETDIDSHDEETSLVRDEGDSFGVDD